jgi:multidrug resistance efflux pump
MSAFPRALQAIRTDDTRRPIAGIVIAVALLGAWIAWLLLARVTRYEVSDAARLEVSQTAYRVEAPVGGKVAAVHYTLGAEVARGDVLVELDDEPLRLELNEKRARLAAVAAQVEPLAREIAARDQALRDLQVAGRSQVNEAKARSREAEAVARFQEAEADRGARLRGEGLVSAAEAARGAADAQARRATAEAQGLAASRAEAEQRSRARGLEADLAGFHRQAAAIEGEKLALQAAIDVLLGAIERQKIRAPVGGKIGEIAVLRAGAFLKEQDPIASIVPRGDLHVIAEFPLASVGRLHAGQAARLRLDAFPWTEYGTVRATVESVGTEAHQGRVRVELGVLPDAASPIPVQHGLTGTAVVEVERVSPATLVLRAAGQLLRTGNEAGK